MMFFKFIRTIHVMNNFIEIDTQQTKKLEYADEIEKEKLKNNPIRFRSASDAYRLD